MRSSRFTSPLRLAAILVVVAAAAVLSQQSALPTATAQETTTVAVGDIWFCNETFSGGVCETTISAGDTVSWDFSGALLPHTTTACGANCDSPTDAPLWDSGLVIGDTTFEFTFDTPGTYLYYCQVHPALHRGRIVVQQDLPPTSTPPPGITGDANCSGGIDSIDAALVLQLVAGLAVSLPCEQNADTNEDGAVNAIDATLILQFDAGLITSLPP